jgi:fructan beta-fructosidase
VTVEAGPSAYSDLALLPDGSVLCLYEGGKDIRIARFEKRWLASEGPATTLPSGVTGQVTPGTAVTPVSLVLRKEIPVNGTHLIVPIANGRDGKPFAKDARNSMVLGMYDAGRLVQSFHVTLPEPGDASWLAAYPLDRYGLGGKVVTLAVVDGRQAPAAVATAFDKIRVGGADDVLAVSDYAKPYRNQFHASTRRGWNNDPNGMCFHDGMYHLYYQHNPLGIFWGNMHWGHMESGDLLHWEEKPIALYQNTVKDRAYSGSGFVDVSNSAGKGAGTLFVAFTSTGRGECLAYSKDGGLSFTELNENPVVKHHGRDPKVLWYAPQKKWVMAVFDGDPCEETRAIPQTAGTKERENCHVAFYESHDLRKWTHTGDFTDGDRAAVFECPELFELPVAGKPETTRWILLAAENRYFIGEFDGKTFRKEAGPLGTTHGVFYAAQTFSDVLDGRRIQVGWVRTHNYLDKFPDQITSQAFTLPHELRLRETCDGLRMSFWPVEEIERLRGDVLAEASDLTIEQANRLLRQCEGGLTETLIEFTEPCIHRVVINGIDASFEGRTARIFSDRTFNEVYVDEGLSYEVRNRPVDGFDVVTSHLTAGEDAAIRVLKVYRLKSIWPQ